MPNKPFANAADQNRDDILPILQHMFSQSSRVLEIGSGTGQHAVNFAKHLPFLIWQASDRKSMLPGIQLWIDDANLPNLPNPIELDVNNIWPTEMFDAAFAANIIHIMHSQDIEALFSGLSATLTDNAIVCIYGPFNLNGSYTSESNLRFDNWLKRRDPESGLRDKTDLDQLAINHGLVPEKSWDMPGNNKILCWKK